MFTALPAIAVLAVLGAVLAYTHRDSSVEDRRRETTELAAAATQNARGYLEDRFSVLAAVAASPTVRGQAPELRRYLLDAATASQFDSMGFVDGRGRTVASTSLPAGSPPLDVSDREYVRQALAGRPSISDAIESRVTGRPIVAFAYPVSDLQGRPIGAITGTLRLDQVGRSLERLLFLDRTQSTIIDGEGNVIVGRRATSSLQPAPEGYPLEEMRGATEGIADNVETADGTRILGHATLPMTGWLVIVDRPRSEVIGPLDRALYAEIGALALLALVGVLLTFATARRLDRLDRRRDEALGQQREIALVLQQSLLPHLRVPEGLTAEAGYVPAQGEMSVGGDWYDLIDTGDGRVAMSVGDVAGHGLGAAATMGKLRSATRSTALRSPTPTEALGHLDRFAATLDGRPLATVVYAVLDLGTGLLRYATAGHPPPLLLRVDGTTEFLEGGRSPLLGIGPGAPARDHADARLAPGDTLILYTDGLVERPDSSIDAGLDALATLAAATGPDPARLASALLASVEEPRRDDAAVLVVQLSAVRQPSSVAS